MTWENRADRVSILAIVFIAGWIASSAFYKIPTLWESRNELAHCVRVAVPVAKQAIVAANTDAVPAPPVTALRPCRNVPVK